MRAITAVLSGIIVLSASPSGAQELRYRPTEGTRQYLSTNQYLLYFVQAPDTLGQPITTETIETQSLSSVDDRLVLSVSLEAADGSFRRDDTYTIYTNGRVLEVNGKPIESIPQARVDVMPRLPGVPVTPAVGTTWSDSVSSEGERPFGATRYEVHRDYRVAEIFDSLSTSVALIIGEGHMRLRQGGWQDSTAGTVWWQEVEGPVADTIWFDLMNGSLIRDVGVMTLTGVGGAGPRGGGITLPSGLHSTIVRELVDTLTAE